MKFIVAYMPTLVPSVIEVGPKMRMGGWQRQWQVWISGHDQILANLVENWKLIIKPDPSGNRTQALFSIFPKLQKFIISSRSMGGPSVDT